jgi:hypothetical protein
MTFDMTDIHVDFTCGINWNLTPITPSGRGQQTCRLKGQEKPTPRHQMTHNAFVHWPTLFDHPIRT